MDLKINFNNTNVLKGYLEQALPQLEMGDIKVIVGKEGGLAYPLFNEDDYNSFLVEQRIDTLNNIKVIETYFNAIKNYLNIAETHAKRYEFGLVSIVEEIINPIVDTDFKLYSTGIGDLSVESNARFERFLEMLKESRENLEQEYNLMIESHKAIFSVKG